MAAPFLQYLNIRAKLVGFLVLQDTPRAYLFTYPIRVPVDVRYGMPL